MSIRPSGHAPQPDRAKAREAIDEARAWLAKSASDLIDDGASPVGSIHLMGTALLKALDALDALAGDAS